jgi:hypothetical protein
LATTLIKKTAQVIILNAEKYSTSSGNRYLTYLVDAWAAAGKNWQGGAFSTGSRKGEQI